MVRCFALLGMMIFLLAGCGVKPRQVDPPNGQLSKFPRTYPQPEPAIEPIME